MAAASARHLSPFPGRPREEPRPAAANCSPHPPSPILIHLGPVGAIARATSHHCRCALWLISIEQGMAEDGVDDWAEWNGDRDAKQQQARESKQQQGERAGESRQKSGGQASQATATAAPAATGNDGGGGGGDSGQPQAATAAEHRPSFALPFQSPASSCSASASPSQLFWAAAFLSHFAFVCFAPSAGSSMLRRPALPTSAPKLRIPSWLFRSVAGGRLRRGRLGDSSLIGPMASEMDASSFDELAAEAPERPPSLEQLKQLTGGRFTQRWLKYMYNRFKNECPSGRMRFAEFKRLFGGFIPDRINDVYLERMFHAFCQNSANLEQLTFRDLVICLSRLCDERPASNAEWTMRLIGRGGQISPQEFHEYCKSVFLLRGKGEQNEQKKRAGSLLLGGGGSPISGRLEQQTHQPQQQQQPQLSRPPTIRSAQSPQALLASAITTPTAAPAIANFVPFVGSQQKRGPASPEQELARAIRRRSSILFKELDADQKGYLTTSDFERFFRTWDQKPLIYTAG